MPRRPNLTEQERIVLSFDHPQVTDTTVWKFFKVPTGRRLRIDAAEYINPTGLAEAATNVFALAVKHGSTTLASWSTDSDLSADDMSIPVDTFMTLTPGAATTLIAPSAAVLSLTATEGGTATLPPGRLVLHCRYVD